MIIDIHSHIGDPWYAYWKKNVTTEDHLTSMDRYGIDKRCVSWWQAHNAPDEGNQIVANEVKAHSDRLIGFSVINPRWGNDAVDEVTKAYNELGMTGLKFHPTANSYYVDSAALNPVIEKAIDYKFPMLFHCGSDPFSHPRNLGNLAKRFPDATIIMAHFGEDAWFEGITVASEYNNIILDTTASKNWYRIINFAIEKVGEDRIVFGIDYPALNPAPEIAKIKDADITESQKQKIMGENAFRLLNLKA
jgi:uncharacterized protein